ncbi:MAG: hypothetical protein CVU39_24780 [Chloroflexi bacterium HGW-Chloroflexi-10]|nr:MAG: hypothetical protein CVU39_24780 [Chloroflexi bacterium HGW-Chloroflexi-10]
MKRNILAAILILVLVTVACTFSARSEPTATPVSPTEVSPTIVPPTEAPTDVPSPTALPPTATPKPTLKPSPTVIPVDPFHVEEFEQDLDNWYWFLTYGREDKMDIYQENDRVVFDLDDTDIYSYLMYEEFSYEDVRLKIRAENRGKNNNSVSLVCRYDEEDGWYEFNINSNGMWTILSFEGNLEGGEYGLIASGGSMNINMGKEYNEYEISCVGDMLNLWINGKETQSVQDRDFKEGLVGIGVSSYNVTPIKVEFEYVDISTP